MKKSEIVEFLKHHQGHHGKITWDIKVNRFNSSGYVKGYEPDPAYDLRWLEYTGQDDYLFWMVCEDLLNGLVGTDKPYEFFDGYPVKELNEFDDYEMWTEGRNGGWLILRRFETLYPDRVQYWDEMPYQILRRLYRFVVEIDKFVAERHNNMAVGYAYIRQEKEAKWQKEDAEEQALAEAPISPYYVPYGG